MFLLLLNQATIKCFNIWKLYYRDGIKEY